MLNRTMMLVLFAMMSRTLGCLVARQMVGYENETVDLLFNINVPISESLHSYDIQRNKTRHLIVGYVNGVVVYNTTANNVKSIGDMSTGNLSIRIASMNRYFEGSFVLKETSPSKVDITCIELALRARPDSPVISNRDHNSSSITGIEDKDVTLVCRSTGGLPKPTMAWYRTSNDTEPLANNTDQPQSNDRTYQLDYKFRAKRADDGATFVCQSSYNPPDPSNLQAEIMLNLSLKPSTPLLSLHTPLREGSNNLVIANCSSAGFKPNTARLTLMLEGSAVVPVANSFPSSSGMFSVTAEYTSTINRTLNGKLLTCSVNHTALGAPLETNQTLDIQFSPDTATLSGESSGIVADVKNKITLTCTAGSSNPPSNITWYRNNMRIERYAQIQQPSGKYNGYVTSQELVVEAVRAIDGDEIFCKVHNIVNEDNHLKSDTITLDLRYHPTLKVSGENKVTEGENMTLRCEASAKPAPTFRWYRNGVLLSSGHNSSSHINMLDIAAVNRTDVDVYQCKASNGYPPDGIKEISLTVKFRPLTANLTGETNIVANGTNKVKLSCTTGSSNPKATIEWFRDNTPTYNNAPLQEYTGQFNGIVTSQILKFVADRNKDGEEIDCRTHNEIEPQSVISSGKKTMDFLFHPIAKLLHGAPVVEGQEKIFHCNVQSKPASFITWYLNDAELSIGNQTQYIIPEVTRTHAGTYRCEAVNGYLPNGNSQTILTVQYAPDVEVTTTNVTVNDSSTQVRCSPSGIPANYTFSQWEHIWPGVGPVVHKNRLGNKPNLTLSQLTYEYSGIYKCSVSNGIHGSLNPNAGHGVAYLQVETYPIITTDGDFKVPGRFNKNTTATIAFYSNVKDNNVECFIGNTTHACSAVFEDGEVNLPVFDTKIQTSGTLVHISLSISSVDHFGVFNIRISNNIGYSERAVEVIPEGPPQIPAELSFEETQNNAVILSWLPGFHGGFNQTFVIEYSTDGQTWPPDNTVEIQAGLTLTRINGTVSNLQSGNLYYMRLMSRNEKGNSNYTKVFNVTTDLSPDREALPGINLVQAIAGGVAAAVAVTVALVVFMLARRRYRKHEDNDTEQSRQSLHEANIHDDSGMEINQAYVSTDDLGVVPSASSGSSNIYAQVNKNTNKGQNASGDNTYAVVNKSKPKADDTSMSHDGLYATPMKKKASDQIKKEQHILNGNKLQEKNKKKEKKEKKAKKDKRKGVDVYENVHELNSYGNVGPNDVADDGNIYENRDDTKLPKRNLNKDGLLYADLEFTNDTKGQRKLVIHGLENATDYVQVDFTKKADPLPDSDDEETQP